MRVNKPRAWDGENMYFPRGLYFDTKGIVEAVLPEYTPVSNHDHHIKVMRPTGLKDKNGTDIYEGDFIKQGEIIAEIIRSNGGLRIHRILHNGIDVSNSNLTSMDENEMSFWWVIGNIYQTPELLNQ